MPRSFSNFSLIAGKPPGLTYDVDYNFFLLNVLLYYLFCYFFQITGRTSRSAPALSGAMAQLSEVQKNMEQIHNDQVFFI